MRASLFKMRFPLTEVKDIANRYTYGDEEAEAIGKQTRSRGYYTRDDFLRLCHWKTPHTAHLCEDNSEEAIRRTTWLALGAATDEASRILMLQSLRGVGWPTASVLLHFGTVDLY